MAKTCESNAINTYTLEGADLILPAGMLSSPQIAYCIKNLNIIENAIDECLGSATYNMRIGGQVLTWKDGVKDDFILGESEDKNKNIRRVLTLRPNSLTFVTTIERLKLPKDIIARFNLKSKLVHKGLLLGTGPIVDPELNAELLIPLHNFSNNDVDIEFGHELISVEFTKTLNPDAQIDGDKYQYVCNKNWKYDFQGYRDRIGNQKIESSVSSTFDKYDKSIKDYEESLVSIKTEFNDILQKTKIDNEQILKDTSEKNEKALGRFNMIGGITVFVAAVGLITLVWTTYQLLSSYFTQLNDATNIIKQYTGQNIDFRNFALASDQDKLKTNFDDTGQSIKDITKTLEKVADDITVVVNKNEKADVELQRQIDELRKLLDDIAQKKQR